MAEIGVEDPARLAEMLSRLLAKERERSRQSQAAFAAQVDGIVRQDALREAGIEGAPPPPAPRR
jgi:hypothetical protein